MADDAAQRLTSNSSAVQDAIELTLQPQLQGDKTFDDFPIKADIFVGDGVLQDDSFQLRLYRVHIVVMCDRCTIDAGTRYMRHIPQRLFNEHFTEGGNSGVSKETGSKSVAGGKFNILTNVFLGGDLKREKNLNMRTRRSVKLKQIFPFI